jgi:hypothetical protein
MRLAGACGTRESKGETEKFVYHWIYKPYTATEVAGE